MLTFVIHGKNEIIEIVSETRPGLLRKCDCRAKIRTNLREKAKPGEERTEMQGAVPQRFAGKHLDHSRQYRSRSSCCQHEEIYSRVKQLTLEIEQHSPAREMSVLDVPIAGGDSMLSKRTASREIDLLLMWPSVVLTSIVFIAEFFD